MATKPNPLVVIVGPTASGKSALALELARRFGGELICADSRTIYKGMDIGTAKPTTTEQAEIPHHMLDIVSPDEVFSAAKFKEQAMLWVDDISIRGKLPIMVGGTGLYIDGVIFDYAFLPPAEPEEREKLESMSVADLQAQIVSKGIAMPENYQNKRYLVRALETNGEIPVKRGIRENTLVIGIDISKAEVDSRIKTRVDQMFENRFLDEVEGLVITYGSDAPGLLAPGYKVAKELIAGSIDESTAKDLFVKNDVQLAKRQRTWFKRNEHILWIQSYVDADKLVKNFLQTAE